MYARDKCRGINQASLISDNTNMHKRKIKQKIIWNKVQTFHCFTTVLTIDKGINNNLIREIMNDQSKA